ncbi:MAG: YbaN family protein [Betaproteobacteria bacterium]|nr:YbaN family protein [Betaproteobacteria bacterium]
MAGLLLPVLPTTPFMLLAAYCFARASPRLHRRLLDSRSFGPMIREWQRHRALAWRTKLTAIALMSATLGVSIVFFVRQPAVQLILALLGVALAVWLYRIPSRDRPR